ncbi:hypothetical protein TeGR_g5230 [Tetraparma gracilis]|uniref:Transmembrane protein n=1 Tax=Tetraparma gracilis TaxID=2962635 RepID=A0ABQ6MIT8_9STRA|nr:hypothetical protein TeGR_g5230 [Tetraparma gracilis]
MCAIETAFTVGGPYVVASWVFPTHKHTRLQKLGYLAFAIPFYILSVSDPEYGFSAGGVLCFFYLFLHLIYGSATGQPPTYCKVLTPPIYILLGLGMIMKPFVPEIGALLIDLGFLYFFIVVPYLLFADKPMSKEQRSKVEGDKEVKHVIMGDGYYFALYIFLSQCAGGMLGSVLLRTSGTSPKEQSFALQALSTLLLMAAQKIGARCTSVARCAALMLVIYLAVDTLQTFLYLNEGMLSLDFFQMIAIQEVFSLCKNGGVLGFLAWAVGLSSTNPYADPESFRLLKSKATVDSLSEIFGAVAAFTFFAVEKELVGMDGANLWNVTFAGNSTLNYISPQCLSTCPVFTMNNEEKEAPASDGVEVVSRLKVLGVFATVLVIRMACLRAELLFLEFMRKHFGKQGTVTPVSEAPISSNSDEGEDGDGKAPAATQRAGQKQASEAVGTAAGVFEEVSLLFLLVSFYGFMVAVANGLRLWKWTPTSDGVAATLTLQE